MSTLDRPTSKPLSRLVLASNNPGKLRELQTLLKPFGVDVIEQGALAIGEAEEPYETFLENALAKARHASLHTGLAALADDSGLCVNALDGAPGVWSARFAGEPRSDERNNARLVADLRGVEDRSAYYHCVLVVVRHVRDPQPLVAEGSWHGTIVLEPRGAAGFGYDPHFYLPQRGCTVAELDTAEKNRLSHRGQALRRLLAQISPGDDPTP